MAANVLNNKIRDDIVASFEVATFKEREEKCVEFSEKVAEMIWEQKVGKYIDALKLMPDFLVTKSSYVKVSLFDRSSDTIDQCWHDFRFPNNESRICWDNCDSSWYNKIDLKSKLGKEIRKYVDMSDQLKGDKNAFRDRVGGVLSGYRSLAKLLKDWPEIEEYVPDYAKCTAGKEIALPTAELNKFVLSMKAA